MALDQGLVFFEQRFFFFDERDLLQCARDGFFEQIVVEWFLDEVVGAEQKCFTRGVDVSERRHHDHFDVREKRARFAQQFDARHVGHADVRNDQVRRQFVD